MSDLTLTPELAALVKAEADKLGWTVERWVSAAIVLMLTTPDNEIRALLEKESKEK